MCTIPCLLQEKDVLQLFTVLRSSTVDVTLTQLTLEQFAILLRGKIMKSAIMRIIHVCHIHVHVLTN